MPYFWIYNTTQTDTTNYKKTFSQNKNAAGTYSKKVTSDKENFNQPNRFTVNNQTNINKVEEIYTQTIQLTQINQNREEKKPKHRPSMLLTESGRFVVSNPGERRLSFADRNQPATTAQLNLFLPENNNPETTRPNRPTSCFPKNEKRPGLMEWVGNKIQKFFSWIYNKVYCASSGNSTEIKPEKPQTKHQVKHPSFGAKAE